MRDPRSEPLCMTVAYTRWETSTHAVLCLNHADVSDSAASGAGAAQPPAPRDLRQARSPLARYALLPASDRAGAADDMPASLSALGVATAARTAQHTARQLTSALLDWARLNAPAVGGNGSNAVAAGTGAASSAPAAKAAANEQLRGSLLQYARLAA